MNFGKYRYVVFELAIGSLLLILLSPHLSGTPHVAYANPAALFVIPGGSGDCSQGNPCNLQTALSRATDGDTVYLAGGTYTGGGSNVATINLNITLYGGWNGAATGAVVRDPAAHPTILDGENARRVVFVGANASPALDGLRLTRGLGGDGGGLYANGAQPNISNCEIFENTANNSGGGVYFNNSPHVHLVGNLIYGNITGTYYGGGVYVRNGAGTLLMNNTIYDNSAESDGGGVYVTGSDDATLQGNRIYTNTTKTYGGGVFIGGSDGMQLADNWLFDNVAHQGGGIYLNNSAQVMLTGNTVYGNTTDDSGGGISLYVHNDGATLTRNAIYANTAGGNGGGLFLYESANATLINNMITENRLTGVGAGGTGIYLYDVDAHLLHTTLARNGGGSGQGIHLQNGATAWLTNTILVSHTTGLEAGTGTTATLAATLWGDGGWANEDDTAGSGTVFTGTLNVRGDPLFVNPDDGDYHIHSDSAAVDAGLDAGVTDDIDGQTRPQDGGFDIGADEFREQWDIYLPLVAKNYP